MKTIKWLGAVILAIALQGCSTLPTPEEMQVAVKNFKLPKYPAKGKSMVYVVRPSIIGTAVRFNVFLDDQKDSSEMGYNRGGQYIYFNVAPGKHTIQSKAENWAECSINPKAGEIIFIQQDPSIGVIMARNSINTIDELTGKYRVKNATLGTIIKLDK